jgi:glycine hydroxymethyltransferase
VEDAFFVAKNLRQLLIRRFFRAAKAGHLSMQLLPKPSRFKKRYNRAFAIMRIKLSRMHRHLPPHLPVTVSDSSQVAPTTQGMREAEMPLIAEYIVTTLRNRNDAAKVAQVREKVAQLCAKFPVYAVK